MKLNVIKLCLVPHLLLLKCKLTVILTLTVACSIHSLYLLLPPSPLENYQEVVFADYEKLLDCCGKQKGK